MALLGSAGPLRRLLGRHAVAVAAPASQDGLPDAALIADREAGNPWTIDDRGTLRRFFFITGCSKSGTHWVQNLLNLHPAVCVKGEFHFEHLRDGYRNLVAHHYYVAARPHVRPLADASYHGMVRRLMYAVATRDKTPDTAPTWIGDRSPRALEEILPGAPTINIRRDGRDVLVSWNFHHMRVATPGYVNEDCRDAVTAIAADYQAHPEKYQSPGSGLLGDETWFRAKARFWAASVEHELDAAPRLRDAGAPVLQVRYEDLHADVLAARDRLYDFLGLDPAPAAPIDRETRTTPGFEHSTHLEFYRKGAVGEWRALFTPAQKQWFKEEAGATLVRAGYEPDASW